MVISDLLAKEKYKLLPLGVYCCLVLLLMGIIVVLWDCFYMYPLIKTMIAEDKAENANLEYKLQEMRDFQTKYKDIHKYEKDAEITYNFSKKLLPVQPALEEYIASLEENAVKYRLMIISLQPAKERKNKQLGEIPLEYGVQGDFFDIMNFLGWLQEGERFTTTNKLQLKCSSDGLECHINTSIFYLIEDK